jgi:hypothetical protein
LFYQLAHACPTHFALLADLESKSMTTIAPHKGHHHNPDAPHRNRYPADYDSTSDYEVKKLGDILKSIDTIKSSIEECKKQIN